jgi:hypothetical protein
VASRLGRPPRLPVHHSSSRIVATVHPQDVGLLRLADHPEAVMPCGGDAREQRAGRRAPDENRVGVGQRVDSAPRAHQDAGCKRSLKLGTRNSVPEEVAPARDTAPPSEHLENVGHLAIVPTSSGAHDDGAHLCGQLGRGFCQAQRRAPHLSRRSPHLSERRGARSQQFRWCGVIRCPETGEPGEDAGEPGPETGEPGPDAGEPGGATRPRRPARPARPRRRARRR